MTRVAHGAAGAASLAAVCLALAGCTAGAPDAVPTSAVPTPTPTPACIVGSWTAGADALQSLYDAIPTALDYPAATIDPAASVTVAFSADGQFALAQDVPVTLAWEGRPAAVQLGGTMRGTYETAGDAVSLAATADALTAVPADASTASALFAAATQETLDEWPVSASSFECGADTLVLDLSTEGAPASVPFARD